MHSNTISSFVRVIQPLHVRQSCLDLCVSIIIKLVSINGLSLDYTEYIIYCKTVRHYRDPVGQHNKPDINQFIIKNNVPLNIGLQ